jgi:hypothetical protein
MIAFLSNPSGMDAVTREENLMAIANSQNIQNV